jgi:hypothetical protein
LRNDLQADPKDKLYLLQFPDPFPKFIPDPARSFLKDVDLDDLKPKAELSDETAVAGSTATDKTKKGVSFSDKPEEAGGDKAAEAAAKKLAAEEEKEKKAKDAKLRALMKKEEARKPEGRIGTMVVMKSGKVKMVLGDGIVMDVSARVHRDQTIGCSTDDSYPSNVTRRPGRSLPVFLRRLYNSSSTWTTIGGTRPS